jgi:hypothetical protein
MLNQSLELSVGILLVLVQILATVAWACWRVSGVASYTAAKHLFELLNLVGVHLTSELSNSVSELFLEGGELQISDKDVLVGLVELFLLQKLD